MKRKILLLLLVLTLAAASLSSCGFLFSFSERTVVYDFGTGGEDVELQVNVNSKAPELLAPDREGYKFIGWYTDDSYTVTYDFNTPVSRDVTLYAYYVKVTDGSDESAADYASLINTLALEGVRATVMLSVEKYDVGGIFSASKVNVSQSSGSGVIYAESGGYYYCLTNNHVVATEKTYADVSVLDYKLDSYAAEVVAQDPEYDLAVVRFAKNYAEPLNVMTFNHTPLAVGETVIAIGTPNGQHNAITVGELLKYSPITIDGASASASSVTFSVIWHSAPMDNGSSGGVLVDTDLSIVGINYAAATSDGEFAYGLTVPTEKVTEFLEKHDLLFENN